MHKVWESVALLIVIFIVVSILGDAIRPFLPLIGIVLSVMILLAAGIVLLRLVIAKRKFW